MSHGAEIVKRLRESVGPDNARALAYLDALEKEVEQQGESIQDLNGQVQGLTEAYEKLTSPANRVGTLLKAPEDGVVLVALGDQEFLAEHDPKLKPEDLAAGARVALNDAYVVVRVVGQAEFGAVSKVSEVLGDGRLRVGADPQNQQGRLVHMAPHIDAKYVKVGDEVRLETSGRFAVEHFGKREAADFFVEEIEPTPWSAIGGQNKAVEALRETIEHPVLYADLYKKFDKKPVKGVLLYGPPGCGKTLLGKAVAWNLAEEQTERTGKKVKECFLHINGPKILNMWLGETERIVREVFQTARDKASAGNLVVLFIDEAESILRTRSTGRWLNISNTVVPQFCVEMDGLVGLNNVVVVLTSNRPDYIDPAILRAERIDRKIKVVRPDKDACREILNIYLHERLPVDPALVADHVEPECARVALIEALMAHLWREDSSTAFLEVMTRSDTPQTLYWKDLVSGALLKSVVDRAKESAIKRAISGADAGLAALDLTQALEAEFAENEVFPKDDAVEDWLRLLDFEPESVVKVRAIRTNPKPLRRRDRIV